MGPSAWSACKRRELQQRKITSLQSISNLGPLARCTFENFKVDLEHLPQKQRESLRFVYNAVRDYALRRDGPEGWLLIAGGFGCGKTHLAAAAANERIRRGYMALFVVVPAFLDRLRSSIGADDGALYEEQFEAAIRSPLLVLDDLGTQSPTPWVDEKLYLIFNQRYNARLPTVITTNYTSFERFDQRLCSRMLDSSLCTRLLLDAPDYRLGEGGAEHLGLRSRPPARVHTRTPR